MLGYFFLLNRVHTEVSLIRFSSVKILHRKLRCSLGALSPKHQLSLKNHPSTISLISDQYDTLETRERLMIHLMHSFKYRWTYFAGAVSRDKVCSIVLKRPAFQ